MSSRLGPGSAGTKYEENVEQERPPTSSAGRPASSTAGELEEEDDDDGSVKRGGARERRKIEIKFIQDKSRRHITFSKRKHGIMKKAWELSVLTGTQVLLLVVSETGLVYTFTTPKLQPLVMKNEGKSLIQACLNAPDSPEQEEDPKDQKQQQELYGPPSGQLPPSMGAQQSPVHATPVQQQQPQHPHQQRAMAAAVAGHHLPHGAVGMPPNMQMDPATMMAMGQQGSPAGPGMVDAAAVVPDGYLPPEYSQYLPVRQPPQPQRYS